MINQNFNIIILASGNGSNAQAIIEFAKKKRTYHVCKVITDQAQAFVRKRCQSLGIECEVIERSELESKTEYFNRLLNSIQKEIPDLVVLAGFMRVLPAFFIQALTPKNEKNSKIINIHPSLLPKYPGLQAYEKSWENHDLISGCTVHFVDENIDTGEILFQAQFEREKNMTFKEFKEKGLKLENKIYPEVIENVLKGKR